MRAKLLLTCLLAGAAIPAFAQPGRVGDRPDEPAGQPLPDHQAANVRVDGAVVEPLKLPPDLAALKVPAGYRIGIFAQDLGNARMLAVADDGTVYLTRRAEGDVQMLRDTNGDGRADLVRTVARRPGMHGIALDGRTAWLVTQKQVYTAPILTDGGFGPLTRIIDDLPDTGQHPNRTIALGPDGMLYLSVGSTCNACTEASPESASMLRVSRDGKSRMIYAAGLRNTIGFDWHPRTGALWGLDHGIDWLGDTQQVEELNRIASGKQYGWPFIYGMGGHNPQDDPPGNLAMEDWDRMSERPLLGTDAHAAPMQMAFYRGAQFPAAEQGSAYAAFRGSWNRREPSGYDVRRVRFDAAGNPVAIEPFVTGFITRVQGGGWGHRGRLAGLAVARDGALLFTDDENGVIYRVSYEGPDRAGSALPKPPVVNEQPPAGPIALARTETTANGRLTVSSPAFGANGAIPRQHSAYYEDISPPLSWGALPAGTRSVAVIMDDPDAASAKPVNHWLAWNIPPALTALPEAVPTLPQVDTLQNIRQGRNSRGSTGYFGPRPPVGDKPHRYHVQLFALDKTLDILPGSDRETLLRAMQGHVLGKGEVVGTYRQATAPTK
jgi:Raf kinase inhibitor-like YbhB/YbcL family protein